MKYIFKEKTKEVFSADLETINEEKIQFLKRMIEIKEKKIELKEKPHTGFKLYPGLNQQNSNTDLA